MDERIRILSVKKGNVTPEVLLGCAELYCQIWKEPPWNEDFWKAEDVRRDILRDSQKPAGECFIATFQNGNGHEVAGFTWGYMSSREHLTEISGSNFFMNSPLLDGNVFYVDELGVNSDFRGHGIGKHLSDQLILNAKANGADSLVLRTDEKALAARALYALLGFNEIPVRDANFPGRTYWFLKV